MANRQRGEVSLTVGGRDYIFRLTTAAMAALEDRCSTPERIIKGKALTVKGKLEYAPDEVIPAHEMFFPDIFQRILKGSAKYTRLLVWAALLDKQPTMTVEDASALIDESGGIFAFSAHIVALSKTLQPDAGDVESRPPAAQTVGGIGARSTSNPAVSA